jgi:hypothetical protein
MVRFRRDRQARAVCSNPPGSQAQTPSPPLSRSEGAMRRPRGACARSCGGHGAGRFAARCGRSQTGGPQALACGPWLCWNSRERTGPLTTGVGGGGTTVGWEPQVWDWRRRDDAPSNDPGWVGQLGRRRRSRERARRRVLSDLPRHRGGLRPQGDSASKGTVGPNHPHTRAVTPGKPIPSVAHRSPPLCNCEAL